MKLAQSELSALGRLLSFVKPGIHVLLRWLQGFIIQQTVTHRRWTEWTFLGILGFCFGMMSTMCGGTK